ncbi:MAG: methylmalonyl-CoA mutase family protein [Saprospiraceae bacterium]
MDWINNLKKSNKKNWIEQIQKENPVEINTLAKHQVFENIFGLSFATEEDLSKELINFSIPEREIDWKIGTLILTQNYEFAKILLDHSLLHGAEYINLNESLLFNELNYNNLTRSVFTEMVKLNFNLDSLDNAKLGIISKYLDKNVSLSFSGNINQFVDLDVIQSLNLVKTYSFSISEIETWPKNIDNFINYNNEKSNRSNKVQILFTHDFLTNISCYRALQKIILECNFSVKFEILIHPQIIKKEIQQNLISFSSIALSASICNPDIITIPPYNALEKIEQSNDLVESKNWLKNSLHLQHILKSESYLNQVNDPIAGSYYIEDLSYKIYQYLKKPA